MNLNLKNKVALITGASAGLGKATAKIFSQEGASLAICGRNEVGILKTKDELMSAYPGSKILAVSADIHTEEGRHIFVQGALDEYGSVDVLVNNTDGPVLRSATPDLATEKDWREVFDGKLQAYMSMTNLVLPYMKNQHWGRIINVVGATGQEPSSDLLAAGVVNAGLINFTKAMATSSANHNVLINAVNPGYIHTERFNRYSASQSEKMNLSVEEVQSQLNQKIPLHRLGTAEEVADLIVFLASDRASYISGVSINVDGGFCKSAF